MILNRGKDLLVSRLTGDTSNALDSRNCGLSVGQGNAPVRPTDTSLTSPTLVKMDAGYPQAVLDQYAGECRAIYRSTFSGGVGNHDWNEWGITNNAAASGVLFNRVVAPNGRKVSGQTWVFTVTIYYRV